MRNDGRSITIETLRFIKRHVEERLGRRPRLRIQMDLPTERIGSSYGGWTICPRGLGSQSTVLSFGVGTDISFDLGLIKRFGCVVHAFDPTPRSIAWLETQELPGEFQFHRYGIGRADGQIAFYAPAIDTHASYNALAAQKDDGGTVVAEVKSIQNILADLKISKINLLKMDIEGMEYDVIDNFLECKILPDQILAEFHHGMYGLEQAATKRTVAALNDAGYRIFDVSYTSRELSLARGAAFSSA